MGWFWLVWIAGWVAAGDGFRRPEVHWLAADRDKFFWVLWVALFPPLMLWFYLVGVLPKLLVAAHEGNDREFVR